MGSRPSHETSLASSPYYTLAEAASLLGVHYETVARWVRGGKIPHVRLSRRKIIVPKAKLDAWLSGEPREAIPAGSPQRWLPLIGTLTPREAASLRRSIRDLDRVEREI